jgi:Glu/Leu/Phe/Val dehydrogenase, dimerisation domain
MNRGYRIQYNSSLGMYAGSLHFGAHINNSTMKALAFDAVISNALVGNLGAAVGGSDFLPLNKSESELQRFCQSYMTELAKYIQHDMDAPWMGSGVGATEMGYLYGQYKRMHPEIAGRYDLSNSAALSGDFPEVRQMLGHHTSCLGGNSLLICCRFIVLYIYLSKPNRPRGLAWPILPTPC